MSQAQQSRTESVAVSGCTRWRSWCDSRFATILCAVPRDRPVSRAISVTPSCARSGVKLLRTATARSRLWILLGGVDLFRLFVLLLTHEAKD